MAQMPIPFTPKYPAYVVLCTASIEVEIKDIIPCIGPSTVELRTHFVDVLRTYEREPLILIPVLG